MARRNFIFYIAALLLLQQTINVSALLNVTNIAIGLGRQLINEVERKENYRSVADVNNKIKIISSYLIQFRDKYQDSEGFFTDDITEELKKTVTGEKYRRSVLVEFDVLKKYEEYVDDYIIYKNLRRFPEKSVVEQPATSSIDSPTAKLTFQEGLKFINLFLTDGYPHDKNSFVKLLTSDKEISRCKLQSRQQLFYNVLKHTAAIDAIGYFLVQLNLAALLVYRQGYEVLDSNRNREINEMIVTIQSHDPLKAMKDFETEFITRSRQTLNVIKAEMGNPRVSRQVWNCNATFNASQEGTAFTKLDNVFQEYIINEADMNTEDSCKAECADYTEAKVHGCFDKTICAKQRKCDGTLWACDKKLGTTTVCLSNNATARYSFIAKDDQIYGHKETCPSRSLVEAKSWRRGFYKCTYCMCTCDNANVMGDRHFNLRPVVSDTEKNFIVTNARFRKVNNIVHIQIQQGRLDNGGRVNKTTAVWKEVASYKITDKEVENGRDYHTITWYRRTFALDLLDSPVNNVLTGLKFSTIEGRLRLEIRATPFDFETGRLFTDRSYWYSDNNFSDRTELELTDKTSVDLNPEKQYAKFTSSSLKIDAGQSTIPYLDLTEVPSFPVVPLAGAGIYHKSTEGVGNFLALKLLTYNYYPHVVA
jgi:hypothetical protein